MFLCMIALIIPQSFAAATDAPENVREWESLWTGVLAKNVDVQGRVDFASLVRDHETLDRVVAFVAQNAPINRPEMFTGRDAQIAYYINAYNALAMSGVVDDGVPTSLGGLKKIMFFYLKKFTVGGKRMSLYDLENRLIRPIGEERIHFLLNCMVVSCPHLPRQAISAEGLDARLTVAARSFVGEDRNVQVDLERRQVGLSGIFGFYTADFMAHAPNLIGYVNRYRGKNIPPELDVKFLDYDWTINNSTRATEN